MERYVTVVSAWGVQLHSAAAPKTGRGLVITFADGSTYDHEAKAVSGEVMVGEGDQEYWSTTLSDVDTTVFDVTIDGENFFMARRSHHTR